ncbi:macro domain-containing protein [Clostridium hydrogenum]|uniref:macro domain-containing protein n=1 Tax=Clostridium hydrogenum TaxID=2855764 RepID=UPI001F19AEF8|nr:macro domain-containing protein [Clostridium hydrogenum]
MFKVKNINLFFRNIASILAWTSTVGGFYLIFYPLSSEIIWKEKIEILIVFILVNSIIAYIMSLPKSKVTLNSSKKVKTNIFFGDLFQAKTNIVIPVNEYFDTLVDNKIITESSVHGSFINSVFGSNVKELNNIIEKKLQGIQGVENSSRQVENKIKYPLGTTIVIEYNGKRYFLVVLSKFDYYNKAYVCNKDYQNVVYSLLQAIHRYSQGQQVNIPLIGAGQSGVKLSKQELLEYLVFSIKMHDDLTVSGGINIILHDSLKEEIDLNKIEYLNKFGGI